MGVEEICNKSQVETRVSCDERRRSKVFPAPDFLGIVKNLDTILKTDRFHSKFSELPVRPVDARHAFGEGHASIGRV